MSNEMDHDVDLTGKDGTPMPTMRHRNPFAMPDFSPSAALLEALAFDLYQLHLQTGISLDKWPSARQFVERYYGPIEENSA